jgi:hypothetical protein
VDVVGVEGRSDLVEVTFDETLGPCHDGLGLRAFLGSGGHIVSTFGGGDGNWRERHAGPLQVLSVLSPIFSVGFEVSVGSIEEDFRKKESCQRWESVGGNDGWLQLPPMTKPYVPSESSRA